jgi:hypothetical protein
MEHQPKKNESSIIIQDGVFCPAKSPWDPKVSQRTGLPLLPVLGLAFYILVVHNLYLLAVWFGLMVVFAWPLRYLICARCPYYGQPCSTNMGLLVARMFPRQEGKSMKPGLWLDLGFLILLFALPLYPAWAEGGPWLTAAWVAAYAVWMGLLARLGCRTCPFTFCPVGRVNRRIWRGKSVPLKKS